MNLYPRKGGHGHITAYTAVIGSKEARLAGFLREDGTSRILCKEVDEANGTITFRVDWAAENEKNASDAQRADENGQ